MLSQAAELHDQLEWKNPDVDGLVDFLVKDKGFKCVRVLQRGACLLIICLTHSSEDRVRKGAEKLAKFLNAKQQGRLDGFFTVKTKTSPNNSKEPQGKAKAASNAKGQKRKVLVSTHIILASLNMFCPGAR